mmetsp:Transcript_62/g.88  ORF Transcript_62/g.88 Transcript_62/m.88 type:complete len:213 (-) Transcript_62:112-750(-)
MNQNVDISQILADTLSNLRDSPSIPSSISLIAFDSISDVFRAVEHGIHRIQVFEFHERTIAKLAALVELAHLHALLENAQSWHPDTQRNLSTRFDEAFGDGPGESLVVSNAGNECFFTSEIDRESLGFARGEASHGCGGVAHRGGHIASGDSRRSQAYAPIRGHGGAGEEGGCKAGSSEHAHTAAHGNQTNQRHTRAILVSLLEERGVIHRG